MKTAPAALGAALLLMTSTAAAAHSRGDDDGGPPAIEDDFTREVLTTGLSDPFEVIYGPDDMLWVTERTSGEVSRVDPETGETSLALTVPDVLATPGEQDGLLGMVLHPDLLEKNRDQYVFLSYTYDGEGTPPEDETIDRRQRIARYTWDAEDEVLDPDSETVLIDGLYASDDHNSGRMILAPDGKLLYTIGDRGNLQDLNACKVNRAQRLPTQDEVDDENWIAYQGKSLRLNQDGTIPRDNPRIDGVRSHVFSYGHRNPQGLSLGPDDEVYSSEQGPKSDDELNLIVAGGNYGWPYVAGYQDDQAYVFGNWAAWEGCTPEQYNAFDIPGTVPQMQESEFYSPDFQPPLRTFFTVPTGHDFSGEACEPSGLFFICYPTVAPSSLEFYDDDAIPGWENSFLMPTLKHGTLYRLPVLDDDGVRIDGPLPLFESVNRYRDTAVSPDGRTIFVATDSSGLARGTNGDATTELENPGSILTFTYTGTD
ncbi:glucose/sorbosone family PQQ-dependent dehydrogenase [Georgenia daeguensis]|uniref:Glucose/Sorbosone dehydrogenase domain-containing protein n=1 Tax=Georgenia daeguensis TaxID=908355 RepID=A0ABP8EXX5_9MICO